MTEPPVGDLPTAPDGETNADADLPYAEALRELEAILSRLESDEPDVDQLGVHVARAAALIRVCRGRIAAARLEVERVVTDLGDVASPP